MGHRPPEFLLVFDEGENLDVRGHDSVEPRRCRIEEDFEVAGISDAVVVSVEPPYGRRGIPLREVVIASLGPSLPLSKVGQSQVPVDIFTIEDRDEAEPGQVLVNAMFDRIARGTITTSEEEARAISRSLRPDFYLVLHHERAAGPWACDRTWQLADEASAEKVLVTASPAIPGGLLGIEERWVSLLMVTRENQGAALLPIGEEPVPVLVHRVRVDRVVPREPNPQDLLLIGTGELYDGEHAPR